MKKLLILTMVFLMALLVAAPAALAANPMNPEFANDDYTIGYAFDATFLEGPEGKTSTVEARRNVANAYGEADALQNAAEDRFTSLRRFEYVEYAFGNFIPRDPDVPSGEKIYDGAGARRIYNYFELKDANGAPLEDPVPDMALVEVTWGTWHVEAVDVYLVDVEFTDETTAEEVFIGRAYNKVGIDRGLGTDQGGDVFCTYEKVGNFGYTNIFFPEYIKSAARVKLVDVTTEENTPPTHSTYKDQDDGYDLDAIVAFFTKEEPVELFGSVTIVKFLDVDNIGVYDEGEVLADGFEFELLYLDEEDAYVPFEPRRTASSVQGIVSFPNLESRKYKIVEILPADSLYEQTTFKGGVFFEIDGESLIWPASNPADGIYPSDGGEVGNVMVGNRERQYELVWGGFDTAWGGRTTDDKAFPKVTGNTKQMTYAGLPKDGAITRTGSSAWSMAIVYNVNSGVYECDLVMGQFTVVGKVRVEVTGGNLVVTYSVADDEAFKIGSIHCGAFVKWEDFKDLGNGKLAGACGATVEGNVVTIPLTGKLADASTLYIPAHCEVGKVVDRILK